MLCEIFEKAYRIEPPSNVATTAFPQKLRTLAFVGLTVGLMALMFPSAGIEKKGRVLLDDRLGGQWEPTARLLDKNWYGDFSTYSFSSLAEWLGKYYSVDVNSNRKYDATLLANYDVLVLKTPEQSLTEDEVNAIQEWVADGGGLLLVGDHTNLMGMGSRLNELCRSHGMSFRFDAASDGTNEGFNSYQGPSYGRHPAAQQVDDLLFMTPCTLEIDAFAESVLDVGYCKRSPHDYAQGSFFSKNRLLPEQEFGRAALCAKTDVGVGRMALFSDSTVWSSFGFFKQNRKELFLGLIDTLNHQTRATKWLVKFIGGIALLGSILLLIQLVQSGRPLLATIIFTLAIWGALMATDAIKTVRFQLPTPQAAIKEVSFLYKGGMCAIPPTLGGLGGLDPEYAFDTFFTATQRMGLFPRVANEFDSILSPHTQTVVVVSPIELPPDSVMQNLRAFVERGGNVLITDRIGDNPSNGIAFLRRLGIQVEIKRLPDGQLNILLPKTATTQTFTPELFGGWMAIGDGCVGYLVGSTELSREKMGHCFTVPGRERRPIYDAVYTVFEEWFEQKVEDRRAYGLLY